MSRADADRDTTTFMLRTVAQGLAVIPTADLERHVRDRERSLERAEGAGALFDPSAWMRAHDDGSFEDARRQLAITKHLLAARKAIDEREAFVATKRPNGPRSDQ